MYQQPLVTGGEHIDDRRDPDYQPGILITSAKFDQEALECLICSAIFPCICHKTTLARGAYMDIYSNGVMIGKPKYIPCSPNLLNKTSVASFRHYDNWTVFDNPAFKAEGFGPFPFCFLTHCDCYGEAVVMRGKCGFGADWFAHANQFNTCSLLPCLACMIPLNIVYGLKAGEADRVASVINQSVAAYRSNQWQRAVPAGMNGPQMQMMMGVPPPHALPPPQAKDDPHL